MNREKLYRAIGNIDEELILEAHECCERQRGKVMMYRIICAAACLCVICGGVLFGLMQDRIYINDLSVPPFSKRVEPEVENTVVLVMSEEEMLAYYGIKQMDELFGEDLAMIPPARFALCLDAEGDIVYDENTLRYSSHNHVGTLSVTLSKLGKASGISQEGLKRSGIDGVSVLLAASVDADQITYRAEFNAEGVFVQMTCGGLSKDEFVQAVKRMIAHIKAVE